MGYGPLMLGHAPEPVVKATQEAVARGSQFAIPHELEYELAKVIAEAVPCADKVSFTNVGSEATFHALRMARAKTGKKKFAKFEGGYHGVFDPFCASVLFDVTKAGPVENPVPVPFSIWDSSEDFGGCGRSSLQPFRGLRSHQKAQGRIGRGHGRAGSGSRRKYPGEERVLAGAPPGHQRK